MNDRIASGKYKLIHFLGRGAFAEVYLAVNTEGKHFACKIGQKGASLKREADFQRTVCHPLFPAVADVGRENGREWILMEYVRGENLEELIRKNGSFSSGETAEIGKKLAEGLGYLHERRPSLLFRDIKPANVMLGMDGGVKLVDFGCVCHAGENSGIAGTVGFGAPEQFEPGAGVGPAADIYGLGKTLQAISGGICEKHLCEVIRSCIRESPGERLPDMRWAADLLALCGGEGRQGKFSGVQKAVLRREIQIKKNIWR